MSINTFCFFAAPLELISAGTDFAARLGQRFARFSAHNTGNIFGAFTYKISRFPQNCLRSDRLSAYEQWGMTLEDALSNEYVRGVEVIDSLETLSGASRFAAGKGRHGDFDDI